MLELALEVQPAFEISTLEIERGGMSYTIDTLLTLSAMMPGVELFLLMGADALVDFPYWRRPAEICRVAKPLVVNRGGEPAPNFEHLDQIIPPDRIAEIMAAQVQMPTMEHSSSDIRRLIATDGAWQELVPKKVASYICEHRLYQCFSHATFLSGSCRVAASTGCSLVASTVSTRNASSTSLSCSRWVCVMSSSRHFFPRITQCPPPAPSSTSSRISYPASLAASTASDSSLAAFMLDSILDRHAFRSKAPRLVAQNRGGIVSASI